MDPIAQLISGQPSVYTPLLILAYLIYQGWNSRADRSHKTNDQPHSTAPVEVIRMDKGPIEDDAFSKMEISKKPDTKD